MLTEEIEPKLNKLREERAQYIEFQKIVREIEYLTRIYISYKYLQYKKSVENCEKNIQAATDFIDVSQLKMIENDKASIQIDQECQLIQQQIDVDSGGELKSLESELSKKLKEEATSQAAKGSADSSLQAEKRNLKALEKSIKDDEKILIEKEHEMANVGDLFTSLKKASEDDAKAYVDAKKRVEDLQSGLVRNEDGESASLQDQMISMCCFYYCDEKKGSIII